MIQEEIRATDTTIRFYYIWYWVAWYIDLFDVRNNDSRLSYNFNRVAGQG